MAVRTSYVGTENVGDVLTKANFDKLPGGWLGYAEVTTAQTGITTVTDLTNLTVTVTVGTNRKIRITGCSVVSRTVGDGIVVGSIQEGATELGRWCQMFPGAATFENACGSVVSSPAGAFATPSAGSHTYKLTLTRNSGTGTVGINPVGTDAAWILVEDIGPAS